VSCGPFGCIANIYCLEKPSTELSRRLGRLERTASRVKMAAGVDETSLVYEAYR
jgi:hypothetical protein